MDETAEKAISPPRRSLLPLALVLAVILTGVNAVKPLHVDDTTYYLDAAQIAAHPFDPYGYVLLYFSDPLPALHVLAPPVAPYWWAAALRLFGDRPLLWKLWLFPFALLFVASLGSILRRFAPDAAALLLVLLVMSPVFLPGLNLMIDIPALALSLTALALFFRACDGDSTTLVVFAGVTAGLAMQTKYTAFLAPALLLAYALLQRKIRLGLSAAVVATLVFAAWETALVVRYGESHFLYHAGQGGNSYDTKLYLLGTLFPILGGVASWLILLALTVLRASRRRLLLAALLLAVPYLLVCFDWADLSPFDSQPTLSDALFGVVGLVVFLSVAVVAWRVLRPAPSEPILSPFMPRGRIAWFLVFWFALELVGYFVLSPFPAVRRILGLTIAATLLIGHLANSSSLEPWRWNVLRGMAVATALLGLGFSGVDYLEARAEQQAAETAALRIRQQHPDADIWYTGYWGFQFYAEKAGMKQAVPRHPPDDRGLIDLPPSHFRKGDWLVVPHSAIPQQYLDFADEDRELMDEIAIADPVPLSTLIWYYAGAPPLRHLRGPRVVVHLFRFKRDLTPRRAID